MELSIYQVDAFAKKTFEGNPAAVCPLENWLPDELLQQIAEENNLSETAFFVAETDSFALRWFTPEDEVDLCGHATLAAAHVLFDHLHHPQPNIHFQTRSGRLMVTRTETGYRMDFPASLPKHVTTPDILEKALGIKPKAVFAAFDYIVEFESEDHIMAITPDFSLLTQLDLRGVVITAPGEHTDFVSRCFFPKLRVNEDPVTGSAHCELAPFWQQRLNKSILTAKQLSKRSGYLTCEVNGSRVTLVGQVADFSQGRISLSAQR